MGSRQVFDNYYGGWGVGWGYGYGYGWGGRGYWGYDGPWVSDETRIAVDVFDARSRKPIWHGAVSQTMYDLTGPNAVAKINAATAAIFTKLPIGTAPVPVAAPVAGAAPVPAAPPAAAPAAGQPRVFMYPKNGQTEQQQTTDLRECQQWAAQNGVAANSSDNHRALVACLDGRGYSVN